MKFSSDGQTLAYMQNGDVVLWNFKQGNQFTKIERGLTEIIKLQFSKHQKHLILNDWKTSRLLNFNNQQKYLNQPHNQFFEIPDTVFFSSTTSRLAFVYGSKDKQSETVKFKIFHDQIIIGEMSFRKFLNYKSYTLSPDLQQIACYKKHKNSLCIYKFEGGQKQKFQLNDQYGLIKGKRKIKFSPDGEIIIGFIQSSKKERIQIQQIWEINNSRIIYETVEGNYFHRSRPIKFKISYDNQSLAIPYYEKISIVNIKSGKVKDLTSYNFHPTTLAFSLNGGLLACDACKTILSKSKYYIFIWDISEGKIIQKLQGHDKEIKKIIFLNEDIIASASSDCTIRTWNRQLLQQIQVLNLHQFEIDSLSISPDRSMMVSKDSRGTIYQWKNVGIGKKNEMQVQVVEASFSQSKKSQEPQGLNEEKQYFFIPHLILGNPKFSIRNCSLTGSKFSSTEGFGLQNIFTRIQKH